MNGAATTRRTTGAAIVVLDAGPLTTIQDLGRRGWAHLGVPRAGAVDRASAALANRLVGNPPEAALLETTMGGTAFETLSPVTLAVTGAECDVRVDAAHAATGTPLTVRAGRTVRVGPARRGVRSYVAVRGGLDVAPVLGSRSTDTLAWVGPPRVADSDVLPVGRPLDRVPTGEAWRPPVDLVNPAVLRIWPGPRAEWVPYRQWAELDGRSLAVGARSDRVGLRLLGAQVRRAAGEVPTEGMVLGSVQLPPSGELVVFLADHPTTGGYPVVAVADDRDLDRCGQLRPGEQVVLRVMREARQP